MPTASTIPPPLELFYSYAHTDEELRAKLDKHLAALQRVELISGWSDRKILPGAEWAAEIQAAMERAGIILLLISSDFLASEYCYKIELPFALKRHRDGSAIVVPVLLRPVEWKDTPFAILQALPDGARAVTLWPNQDEAFAEIAARLRERIYANRIAIVKASAPPAARPSTVEQQRVLDAAVASSIVLGEPADVVTLVRTVESDGLKAILRLDPSFNIPEENVQSKSFEVEFPRDAAGQPQPAALELILESPGCDPPQQRRKLRVPPSGDSDVCVFLLTPLKAGRLMLSLQVHYDDVEVRSQLLVTNVGQAVAAAPYTLVSLPLTSTAAWNVALPGTRKLDRPASPLDMPQPENLKRFPMAQPQAAMSQRAEPEIYAGQPPPSPPRASAPIPIAPSGQRKSWLTRPIMATAASAAALVVVGGVLFIPRPGNQAPVDVALAPPPKPSPGQGSGPISAIPPPPPPSVATGGTPVQGIVALRPPPKAAAPIAQPSLDAALAAGKAGNYQAAVIRLDAAIKEDPKNAELYWRRAEAYNHLGERDLAMSDLDQAIRLAPGATYPYLLKGEILSAAGLHQQAVQQFKAAAEAPSASAQAKQFALKRAQQSAVKEAH